MGSIAAVLLGLLSLVLLCWVFWLTKVVQSTREESEHSSDDADKSVRIAERLAEDVAELRADLADMRESLRRADPAAPATRTDTNGAGIAMDSWHRDLLQSARDQNGRHRA